MEPKARLWSKYSKKSRKAIKDEADKGQELEKSLKDLNEKLAFVISESIAKDDLLAKEEKVAEEAIAGWEKAEVQAAFLQKELDDAQQQRLAAEARAENLDVSLKECMQQLDDIKEERDKMINDLAEKISREEERAGILEEKLVEVNKRVAKFVADHDYLNAVLGEKEKMIIELNDCKLQEEEKSRTILTRLDSSEKRNVSLRYEVCMLEKELQIRNEERDFNLKSVDTAHKQHLVSIKKIAKLEAECHRLRVMLRKRLPGPAALAKMKSEVEMLGNDDSEMQRRKSNVKVNGVLAKDNTFNNHNEASNKRDTLVEKLHATDEENNVLKEALAKRNDELQSSRLMCARTASKLSHVEKKLEELTKLTSTEIMSRPLSPCDFLASISEDKSNEDNTSSSESWASALISELEHFRNGKCMTPSCRTGASDVSLTDDFVEVEKLAITSVTKSCLCEDKYFPLSYTDTNGNPSEATRKELVSLGGNFGLSDSNCEVQLSYMSFDNRPNWLKDILRVILQKHHLTQKRIDVIFEEARTALADMGHMIRHGAAVSVHAGCNISHKSPDSLSVSIGEADCINLLSSELADQQFQGSLEKPLYTLIELVEEIKSRSLTDCCNDQTISANDASNFPQKKSLTRAEFASPLFQGSSSQLKDGLENFVQVCNGLLHGRTSLEKFISELTWALKLIVSHCLSIEEISSTKGATAKDLNGDCPHNKSEVHVGLDRSHLEAEASVPEEFKRSTEMLLIPSATSEQTKDIGSKMTYEDRGLRIVDVMNTETQRKNLKAMLQSESDYNESLVASVHKSDHLSLQMEHEKTKQSTVLEGQIEKQKVCNEDFSTQTSDAETMSHKAFGSFPSLKQNLEDKNGCSEDPQEKCLDPQTQLESAMTKESTNLNVDQEQRQLRTNQEISAAAGKLAECQETILNLGKQLKALASSQNPSLFEVMVSMPAPAKTTHHLALRDQLLAEANAKPENPASAMTVNTASAIPQKIPTVAVGNKHPVNNGTIDAGALAIVPKKQKPSVSLWKRVLLRRKKESIQSSQKVIMI